MNQVVTPKERLRQLQQEILAMQGLQQPLENECCDMGLGIISHSFPNQVFPVAATHEFISDSYQTRAASSGFMAALVGVLMRKGSCLWVSTQRRIFPPALQAFGICPDQVIFVDAHSDKEALWIMEEGLKCESLSAVVGEIGELGFTESRRLQLAVEQSRVTGLIHRYNAQLVSNLACVSRWRVRPAPSVIEAGAPGVGFPGWQVELLKIRNGRPGSWQVAWYPNGFKVAQQSPAIQYLPARKTG